MLYDAQDEAPILPYNIFGYFLLYFYFIRRMTDGMFFIAALCQQDFVMVNVNVLQKHSSMRIVRYFPWFYLTSYVAKFQKY